MLRWAIGVLITTTLTFISFGAVVLGRSGDAIQAAEVSISKTERDINDRLTSIHEAVARAATQTAANAENISELRKDIRELRASVERGK